MKLKSFALSLLCGFLVSASAFAYEAVIVYNPQSGHYGSFRGNVNYATALNQAVANCGPACESNGYIQTFGGDVAPWIALAVGPNGAYGTAGIHDSEQDAEANAIANCNAKPGSQDQCAILRSTSAFPWQEGVRPNN